MTEVMVAVVVFSIGMLGLARLQLASFSYNHSAYLRSIATVAAYDMADRMRANRIVISGGHYNAPLSPAKNANCLAAAGCTPQQMAGHDIAEWRETLASTLPQGQGMVCIDSSPDDGNFVAPDCDNAGNVYAIKVWWIDERDGSTKRFVTAFRP